MHVVDEHSIHSPFFFDFHQKVIDVKPDEKSFAEIETLRRSVLNNTTAVQVEQFGAGSKVIQSTETAIGQIAATSVTPARYAQLYHRIIEYTRAKYIVELGTSLGINTLYLSVNPEAKVFTFEGSEVLNSIALTHFEAFERTNVIQVKGNIDRTLPDFLQGTAKLHFVLMDANHQYEPTLRYFNLILRRLNEKSVVVVDDIYWSEEMARAWRDLRDNKLVYGSIDLYRCGILFFDPALNRQHFVLSLPSK